MSNIRLLPIPLLVTGCAILTPDTRSEQSMSAHAIQATPADTVQERPVTELRRHPYPHARDLPGHLPLIRQTETGYIYAGKLFESADATIDALPSPELCPEVALATTSDASYFSLRAISNALREAGYTDLHIASEAP